MAVPAAIQQDDVFGVRSLLVGSVEGLAQGVPGLRPRPGGGVMEDLQEGLDHLKVILRECPNPAVGELLVKIMVSIDECYGYRHALMFLQDHVLGEGGMQEMMVRVMYYIEDTLEDIKAANGD